MSYVNENVTFWQLTQWSTPYLLLLCSFQRCSFALCKSQWIHACEHVCVCVPSCVGVWIVAIHVCAYANSFPIRHNLVSFSLLHSSTKFFARSLFLACSARLYLSFSPSHNFMSLWVSLCACACVFAHMCTYISFSFHSCVTTTILVEAFTHSAFFLFAYSWAPLPFRHS